MGDAEMTRLYSGYRGALYTNLRSKWERWYSYDYNTSHEKPLIVNQRSKVIFEFLSSHNLKGINSILDIGGDQGQFIPELNVGLKKYVMEKSNRKLRPGVQRIDDLSEINSIDIIIYAHILEHVADPILELSKLLKASKYVYVEVPIGIPSQSRLRKSHLFQWLIAALSLSPKIWSYLSSPAAGRLANHKILRQSEHLNFFSEKSLQTLAMKLNAQIIIKKNLIPTPDLQVMNVYQVLMEMKENL
jgi:hypothetical protein